MMTSTTKAGRAACQVFDESYTGGLIVAIVHEGLSVLDMNNAAQLRRIMDWWQRRYDDGHLRHTAAEALMLISARMHEENSNANT